MSTGGLEPPGVLDDQLYFTAMYVLFGVPLYSVFISRCATRMHVTMQWFDSVNEGAAANYSESEMRTIASAAALSE